MPQTRDSFSTILSVYFSVPSQIKPTNRMTSLSIVVIASAARHVSTCYGEENHIAAVGGNGQARSGFHQLKSKFMPSLLAPLEPFETPQASSQTQNNNNNGQQYAPQTTRGTL